MNDISTASILVDNESWILPAIDTLISELGKREIEAVLVRRAGDVPEGDVCFLLGCTGLVEPAILARNRHNLVVHESALPAGKGFAPMTWSILEGSSEIPICLFEATERADAGDVWLEDIIELDGYELCAQWRQKQAEKTIQLCIKFIENYDKLEARPQSGDESFYPRRSPEDSELDPDRSLREQFNLLRVVDNERYPAFFTIDGHRYRLRIERDGGADA